MNSSFLMIACSGPGAGAAIRKSIAIGYFSAAIGGVIILALTYDAWRARRLGFALPIAVLMLLIHPAWTVSAVSGDCGFHKREVSNIFTAVFFALMLYQHFASKRKS